ncbi:MAG: CpXC domain-containing protein [Roseiflexaceae bacterium]
MPISYSEQTMLTCPSCGKSFEAEVWTLVDTAERPDLLQALQDETLDRVTCPHCGYSGASGAPLLLHDPQQRRVYFAVPPGVEEHRWRERAQELLYALVGSLPEEARLPYLGDVQVNQEVAGMRRSWMSYQRRLNSRRGASAPEAAQPTQAREPVAAALAAPPAEDGARIYDLVQQLLAADSATEFQALVERNPVLLSEAADLAVGQLIEAAYAQGEHEIGEALRTLRGTLSDLRGGSVPARETAPAPAAVAAETAAPAETATSALPELAYQALLRVATNDDLQQTVRDYPVLLEGWIDQALAARAEAVLDEGNERLAVTIEERREALAELRHSSASEPALLQAIEVLLHARDEQALEQAITGYPVLLTEAAQTALLELSAGARSRGDSTLAEYAIECRALLHRIREELEQG